MSKVMDLSFCFKGAREYIHGTDIYNQLINLYKSEIKKDVDLSFHGIARKNISLYDDKPANLQDIKFVFKYTSQDGTKRKKYGVENGIIVNCRYEYDEDKITSICDFKKSAQEVYLSKNSPFSFIENIVALNKYLLESLYPRQTGKWYFTRLQLVKSIDSDIVPIRLKLVSNFNFKLTKTKIESKDKVIGYIYFSMV